MDAEKLGAALERVRQRKDDMKRERELFYTFVFAVFFGIVSALAAEMLDNVVRNNMEYPLWYVIAVLFVFFLTIGVLVLMFLKVRGDRRDVEIMEENFEEMLEGH